MSLALFGGLAGWFFWRWSRHSEDTPKVLIKKILVTVGLVFVAVVCMLKITPFLGVPLAAFFGIIIGAMWGKNVGSMIARPFTSCYDGGTEETQPRPFYAIAHARRKQGQFAEAIRLIEEQLERFPDDPEGCLLLAEIHARNLSDWSAAAEAVERVANNGALAVATRARALVALADWLLDLANDGTSARALFQRIIDEFPDTPESRDAAQRLAHVGDGEWRREKHAPTRLKLPVADQRLGLRTEPHEAPEDPDPELEIQEALAHLAKHPADTEVRERLVMSYAEKLGRLDWARAEIERGLGTPNTAPKQVAHWLHLLADLEVRHGGDEAAARAALGRIVEKFPDTALAANAQSRLERIRLEIKGRRTGPTVRPSF